MSWTALPRDLAGERPSSDDHIITLVGVVSELVSRVDSTQQQLSSLQLAVSSPLPAGQASHSDDMGHLFSQGEIPKRSADGAPSSCSAEQHIASLAEMRADQSAVRQATQLVDMMDSSVPGTNITNSNSTVKSMRHSWSRQGGNFTPCVIVPCSQDFVLGTGRKNRLNYDDLDVL
jgi:hypothetical protein